MLLVACREAGLQTPKKILKDQKDKDGSYVLGLTATQLSAVMLVATPFLSTFQGEGDVLQPDVYEVIWKLLTAYREMVVLIYYTPEPCTSALHEATDRYHAVRLVCDRMAEYLKLVEELCASRSGAGQRLVSDAVFAKVDTPNLHRAPEFVGLWLPGVDYNIRHLQELLYEKVHTLAKFLASNNEYYNDLGLHIMNRLACTETISRIQVGPRKVTSARQALWNTNRRRFPGESWQPARICSTGGRRRPTAQRTNSSPCTKKGHGPDLATSRSSWKTWQRS